MSGFLAPATIGGGAYLASATPPANVALFVGAPSATASFGAALTSAIRMAAAPAAAALLGAVLTTPVQMLGAPAASASLVGALTTQIRLAGAPAASSALAGALISTSPMTAAPIASASLGSVLASTAPMAAAPRAVASFAATLTLGTSVPVVVTPPVFSVAGLTSVFPDLSAAVQSVITDRLARVVIGGLADSVLDPTYVLSKLRAAEADCERQLKVFFTPVKVIPDDAPDAEVQALETAGTRYVQEAAFDFEQGMFYPDEFGYLALGHRPIIAVDSVQIAAPTPFMQAFTVPADWLRLDRRAGVIRFYPTSTAVGMPVAVVSMGAWAAGSYPNAIKVRYTAGLKNAARDYPDLLDIIKRMAVVRIIDDLFLPSSGSISADGLSQSQSVDVASYKDQIDRALFGPKGSNGGLYTAIHGITFGVL